MFQLFFLGELSRGRLPLYPAAAGVVPALAERNPLLEDMVVPGLPSGMMSTGLRLCHVHDPLCALARTRAHGPHRDDPAFARKALGSAGGEVLATAATVIAAGVIAAEARTEAGVGIDVRQLHQMS